MISYNTCSSRDKVQMVHNYKRVWKRVRSKGIRFRGLAKV